MFTSSINNISLGTEKAAELYPSIEIAVASWPDNTLAIAARMLYEHRTDKDHILHFAYSPNVANCNKTTLLNLLESSSIKQNSVCFACGNSMPEQFEDFGNGWHEQQNLKDYLTNVLSVRGTVIVNEDQQKTLVCVQYMTLPLFHFLCALLPRYTPWLFKEAPLTEKETKLLFSLKEHSDTAFRTLVEEYMIESDFTDRYAQIQLKGFETRVYTHALEAQKNVYDSCADELQHWAEQEANTMKRMRAAATMMRGLKLSIKEAQDRDSAMASMFKGDKRLRFVSAEQDTLTFDVITNLEHFDPEVYEDIIANEDSYLFDKDYVDSSMHDVPYEDMKLVYDAVFSEDAPVHVDLLIGMRYCIDMNGMDVTNLVHVDYKPFDCIPNPHLEHYHCFGDHRRYIVEAMRNGNVEGAVAQCIASAGSVNVGEGPTMERFVGDLTSCEHKCFIMPDGTHCNMREAINWLKDA